MYIYFGIGSLNAASEFDMTCHFSSSSFYLTPVFAFVLPYVKQIYKFSSVLTFFCVESELRLIDHCIQCIYELSWPQMKIYWTIRIRLLSNHNYFMSRLLDHCSNMQSPCFIKYMLS